MVGRERPLVFEVVNVLELFEHADDPESALRILRDGLTRYYLQPTEPLHEHETPAIAKSRIPGPGTP